jgi:hypothetical protein
MIDGGILKGFGPASVVRDYVGCHQEIEYPTLNRR